jgi:hypothetical protein
MKPPAARFAAAVCVLAVLAPARAALAWGATGHRMVGVLAAQALPADLPAFLHQPLAVETIGEFAREPDRSKASGKVHDSMRDPAHFTDVDDNGKVLGGPALAALPPTRAEFEIALRAVDTDSSHAGYLPYAIVDGWQQLSKDFAYWRVLTAAIPRERDAGHKAWMERDLARRETLILHDLGVWAHFVGDGSQPMHVSVHYNGWGDYPNPNGYTQERVHGPFEGAFVRQYVGPEAVRAAMAPPNPCAAPIEACTAQYLAATLASVEPFYALQKAGGFAGGDARGRAFAAARLAAAADELRDLTVAAWAASAQASVGYPAVTVEQVVKGGVDPYDVLFGED